MYANVYAAWRSAVSTNTSLPAQAAAVLTRLRDELRLTQAAVAKRAGLDQSRVSRIEKGEVVSSEEIERVCDALEALGSPHAASFKEFVAHEWVHIEPPLFWNPQRGYLETADGTLQAIDSFLQEDERPWPLRRQIERHRESLLKATSFLTRLDHNIAFVGELGVGKSTAISFIFDLLVPSSLAEKAIDRPILETGAGGTTICEVHAKRGPEFGLSLLPMSDGELRQLVADFCASKWLTRSTGAKDPDAETVGVSSEADRAIRNMSGLLRRREMTDGKIVYYDPVQNVMRPCTSEDEFRTRILELMHLPERTQRELWYDSATRKHPMEWAAEVFKAVNNGRVKNISLPRSIDLLVPDFGRNFGELEVTIIDTKGVDDVAVREDLELRLKDARTAVVFCCRFNEAPGTATRALLDHMRQTFSERVDTGKVSILALPRAGEARKMKDDAGELAIVDAEGYAFKGFQITDKLAAEELSGVPVLFFNVESDDPAQVREKLFEQLNRMRETMAERLLDLCAAIEDLIHHHETKAVNAAVEEVANRLRSFLEGNRRLGARERLAYEQALQTIRGVRYASTLWASTRRCGEYSGLNVIHQIGIGAARDARARCGAWFHALDAFLNGLKSEKDLTLAAKTIEQIARSASASRTSFLDAVQRAGTEVYQDPLTKAPVWPKCAAEWGKGPGFKNRVVNHLEPWLQARGDLKDKLEDIVTVLWEQLVISPLLRLSEEPAPESDAPTSNVIEFRERARA
jgi:transcriptional regulator with XRE-family HTH domain